MTKLDRGPLGPRGSSSSYSFLKRASTLALIESKEGTAFASSALMSAIASLKSASTLALKCYTTTAPIARPPNTNSTSIILSPYNLCNSNNNTIPIPPIQ